VGGHEPESVDPRALQLQGREKSLKGEFGEVEKPVSESEFSQFERTGSGDTADER